MGLTNGALSHRSNVRSNQIMCAFCRCVCVEQVETVNLAGSRRCLTKTSHIQAKDNPHTPFYLFVSRTQAVSCFSAVRKDEQCCCWS